MADDWDVVDQPTADPWDIVQEPQVQGSAEGAFLHGATLGLSKGAVQSGLETMIAANPKLAELVGDPAKAAEDFDASRKAYEKEHPAAAGLAEAAGSTLTTLPILGLASGAEQAALRGAPALARFAEGTGPGLLRMPSLAFAGAKTGAEAGAIGSGVYDDSFGSQVLRGAEFGGGANLLAPLVRYVATPVGRAVEPLVQSAVAKARSLGLDLNLTQYAKDIPRLLQTGTKPEQMTAVNQLVNREMGAVGDTVTPEGVTAAQKAISQKFKSLEGSIQIDPRDTGLNQALGDVDQYVLAKYPHGGKAADQINAVTDEIRKDMAAAHARTVPPTPPGGQNMLPPPGGASPPAGMQGTIPGIRYFALTERGGPIDELIRGGAGTNEPGVKLRQALDAAADAGNPGTVDALKEARGQYKASLVAEKLAKDASLHGQIDPTRLKEAVQNIYGLYGWGPDGTALSTIGDVGKLLNKPTAQGGAGGGHLPFIARLAAGSVGLGELVHLGLDPWHAAAVAGAATGASFARKGMQAYINSPWYRNMLTNPAAPLSDPFMALGTNLVNSEQSR